jgi:hypothetical protein
VLYSPSISTSFITTKLSSLLNYCNGSYFTATYKYFLQLDFKLFRLYNYVNESAVNILITHDFVIISYTRLM